MKIAAVCDFPYWQADVGSAVRQKSLCQSLSDICDLTVLCSAPLSEEYAGFAESAPYRLLDGAALDKIATTIPGPGMPGIPPERTTAVQAIRHYCETEDVDAVVTPYFNRFWMIEHIRRDILRIVDTIDCQSQRTRSFAQHGLTPTFHMTAAQEGALLDRYDLALAISDEDQAAFQQMTDIPIVTVPFRFPARPLPTGRRTTGNALMFIAARSPVNDMTLRYLLQDIMPLVNRRTLLRILGSVTVPDKLPGNTAIIRPGRVADLATVYAQTDLALNPTFAGGGVKTKTLEAIAYGVPILTSDEGARGLRALLPDLLIANDKETFAHRIGVLLDAPTRRAALTEQMLGNLAAERPDNWQSALLHLLTALRGTRQKGSAT